MSIGWIIVVESAVRPLLYWWQNQRGWLNNDEINALGQSLIALSPMGGQVAPLEMLSNGWNWDRDLLWKHMLFEVGFVAAVAVVFLGLTLLTFNRCMGRMNESPEVRRYVRAARFARQRQRSTVGRVEAARPA
jgi:hypothetical protein